MSRITDEMIEACYEGGASIFNNEVTLLYARNRIERQTGMNAASASYYLSAVVALLSGGEITRDINRRAVDFYLGKIRDDFGEEALRTAASVCMRRYEETERHGSACLYYKAIADEHLEMPH